MFLIFPFGTDAPLYYRPFATIGLIVANVVAFAVTGMGADADGWLLRFGDGLHPTEWFLSAFLHFGVLHLAGNMLFLWIFGLIVEGKLGWWRFLLLYLGLCGVDGAVSQTLMLSYAGEVPGAGGASAVVFALLAISLLWAPRNSIDVFLLVVFFMVIRTTVFEVTVLTFSLCYVGLNFVIAWLEGFAMSSALSHLLGAVIGGAAGAGLLRLGLVDCERWDLFSLWRGGTGGQDDRPAARDGTGSKRHPPALPRRGPSPVKRLKHVRKLVEAGQYLAAWTLYPAIRAEAPEARLDEPTLRRLIDGVHRDRDWAAAADLLEDYLAQYPASDTQARLMLAGIYVQEQHRPRAALNVLAPLEARPLTPAQREFLERVRGRAKSLVDSGVMELSRVAAAGDAAS
jgi:membrane associated rhomboid family serine protease